MEYFCVELLCLVLNFVLLISNGFEVVFVVLKVGECLRDFFLCVYYEWFVLDDWFVVGVFGNEYEFCVFVCCLYYDVVLVGFIVKRYRVVRVYVFVVIEICVFL